MNKDELKSIKECNDVATPIDVALRKRIAELEAAQRWIPVSERLPEHGDFVLAWDNEIIEVLKYIRTFGGEWFIDIADAAVYPTHWMPLPEPPNDTQTQTIVYGKEDSEVQDV